MEKKKVIIIGLGLAGVAAAIYFIFKPNLKNIFGKTKNVLPDSESKKVAGSKTNTVQTTGASITGCNNYKQESFPIAKGMKGTNVKAIQTILNELYSASPKLVVDGCFGTKTETALNKAIGRKTLTQTDYNSLAKAGNTKVVEDDTFSISKFFSS